MTFFIIFVIAIGIRHAFEPDHIAAIFAISTQSNSLTATAKQGAIWGIGHTITLLIFSMIFLGFKVQINESVFFVLEFIIGLVLIIMGINVIKKSKVFFSKNNFQKSQTQKKPSNGTRLSLKALGIGLLHGAAGSGVIIAIITATIDSIYLKFTYIAFFSIGLIICMSLLSIFMSTPLHRNMKIFKFEHANVTAGIFAIIIGMQILYQSGLKVKPLLF